MLLKKMIVKSWFFIKPVHAKQDFKNKSQANHYIYRTRSVSIFQWTKLQFRIYLDNQLLLCPRKIENLDSRSAMPTLVCILLITVSTKLLTLFCMPTKLKLGFGQRTSPMKSTDKLTTDFKKFLLIPCFSFLYQELVNKIAEDVLFEGLVLRRWENQVSNVESRKGQIGCLR